MSKNIAAAEILEAAAFVIGTGHFCKGNSAVDANGSLTRFESGKTVAWCLVGAMSAARYTLGHKNEDLHSAELAIQKVIRRQTLWSWNDAPSRTAAEVETAMLQAAANLRGEA